MNHVDILLVIFVLVDTSLTTCCSHFVPKRFILWHQNGSISLKFCNIRFFSYSSVTFCSHFLDWISKHSKEFIIKHVYDIVRWSYLTFTSVILVVVTSGLFSANAWWTVSCFGDKSGTAESSKFVHWYKKKLKIYVDIIHLN